MTHLLLSLYDSCFSFSLYVHACICVYICICMIACVCLYIYFSLVCAILSPISEYMHLLCCRYALIIMFTINHCWMESISTFEGASFYPYSVFQCKISIGGWGNSGWKVNYDDLNGVAIEAQSVDPEFTITTEKSYSEVLTNVYPCCPDEPWPIVNFYVGIKAQSLVYSRSLILTNLALVYLSFGLLWMDLKPKVDLLSLGSTYVLSMVSKLYPVIRIY